MVKIRLANQNLLAPKLTFEPAHDENYQMACASREDSDQPGHPPSLIRVFAVRPVGS